MGRGSFANRGGGSGGGILSTVRGATRAQENAMDTLKQNAEKVGGTIQFQMQDDGVIAFVFHNPQTNMNSWGTINKNGKAVITQSASLG